MTIGRTRLGPQGKGYLHTTDATADQLVKTWEIPFKHTATVTIWVVAIADTGDYLFERSTHLVTRDGATATYVGEVANDTLSSGAGAWVTTIDCTGTTLRLRFTGEAAHLIEVTAIAVFDVSAVNVPIVWECATTDATQDHWLIVTNAVNYWVDWGDGALTAGTGTGGWQNVTHNYAAAGQYAQRWMIDDLADLLSFHVNGNGLLGNNPTIENSPAITSFNSGSGNRVGGGIASLTNNVSIVNYYCDGNTISAYAAGVIAASCTGFVADNNLLPVTAIDQILADFETGVAGRPAAGTISLGGTGNAPPSAAGLASKAAILAAKPGWTITHN